jgi:hypothetical protein
VRKQKQYGHNDWCEPVGKTIFKIFDPLSIPLSHKKDLLLLEPTPDVQPVILKQNQSHDFENIYENS